jgi:hypothetical protein
MMLIQAPTKVEGPSPYIYLAGSLTGYNWQDDVTDAVLNKCSHKEFTLIKSRSKTDTSSKPCKHNIKSLTEKNVCKKQESTDNDRWQYKAMLGADLCAFWFSFGNQNPTAILQLGFHMAKSVLKMNETGYFMSYPSDIIVGCPNDYHDRLVIDSQMRLMIPKSDRAPGILEFSGQIIDWIEKYAEDK